MLDKKPAHLVVVVTAFAYNVQMSINKKTDVVMVCVQYAKIYTYREETNAVVVIRNTTTICFLSRRPPAVHNHSCEISTITVVSYQYTFVLVYCTQVLL